MTAAETRETLAIANRKAATAMMSLLAVDSGDKAQRFINDGSGNTPDSDGVTQGVADDGSGSGQEIDGNGGAVTLQRRRLNTLDTKKTWLPS
jgi:hypothetical protein